MNLIYSPLLKSNLLVNPFDNVILGIENYCSIINNIFYIFFANIKYIFAIILLIIGIMTLLRCRGIYQFERMLKGSKNFAEKDIKEKVKQSHVLLGVIYICMAVGIFTNYFTYFLIWLLDPLPDRFIFMFAIFFQEIDPFQLNHFSELNAAVYPHELTIYFSFAFVSFIALVQIFVCIWSIINSSGNLGNPMNVYTLLFAGVLEGMFFGFTTCLPFFI